MIFYLPAEAPAKYKRILLRSDSYNIPADCIVEIEDW